MFSGLNYGCKERLQHGYDRRVLTIKRTLPARLQP